MKRISYEPVNPHVLFAIEVGNEDGEIQRWRVEGTSLTGLERRGVPLDVLKAGDAIEVCGFLLKDEVRDRVPPAGRYPTMFLHGDPAVQLACRATQWHPFEMAMRFP